MVSVYDAENGVGDAVGLISSNVERVAQSLQELVSIEAFGELGSVVAEFGRRFCNGSLSKRSRVARCAALDLRAGGQRFEPHGWASRELKSCGDCRISRRAISQRTRKRRASSAGHSTVGCHSS